MASKSDVAKELLLKFPEKTNAEIAELAGCCERQVKRAKAKLKAGDIPKEERKQERNTTAKEGDSTFIANEKGAEYTFNSKKRIVSQEDLIQAANIDLTQWQIERWVCNKWDVGMKAAAIGGSKAGWRRKSDKVVITPLFQIKLWLKPLHTQTQKGILTIIEELVKKHSAGEIKKIPYTKTTSHKACKATVTDMHVGLDPNPNKRSLYLYEYGEKQFNENLDAVFNSIMEQRKLHGKFDVLFFDDLGDGLDGWNGLTTRGGHKLDQNLDNREQFKVYVEGKLRIIENVIKADIANRIVFTTVTDDNHAGDFSYTANWAIQKILERSYCRKQVEYNILQKFMEHYTYGDHTYILTHGKDSKNMFRGLPLALNEKALKFINDYIRRYKINTKYIHVEKGDLHQVAYEKVNEFDYRNFMAFAPPSSYVQTNFGDSYSGYSIQIINERGGISHQDHYFDIDIS